MNGDIAQALNSIAIQLSNLGNGNAATNMGAIEAHGKFTSEALSEIATANNQIAGALDNIAQAIEIHGNSLDNIADAIEIQNNAQT